MDIQILGTYPGELSQRFILTTYVINGELAIDAGAIGLGLTVAEQKRIQNILVTHTHIDHLATLPIFIDNRWSDSAPPPVIHATAHNLAMVKKHLFNNVLWPELQSISDHFFTLRDAEPYQPVDLERFTFYMFPVNHPVPTYGIVLEEKTTRSQVLFTSDTTICDVIWIEANRSPHLKAIFSEISFPDAYVDLAQSAGHLTPKLLEQELRKLKKHVPIYLTHYKNQYVEQIEREIAGLSGPRMHIARAGEMIHIE